jgi:hypothetical protein
VQEDEALGVYVGEAQLLRLERLSPSSRTSEHPPMRSMNRMSSCPDRLFEVRVSEALRPQRPGWAGDVLLVARGDQSSLHRGMRGITRTHEARSL